MKVHHISLFKFNLLDKRLDFCRWWDQHGEPEGPGAEDKAEGRDEGGPVGAHQDQVGGIYYSP